MKPLIIGQAPARGNDGRPPFAGRSGARLAMLAGVGDDGDCLPEYFDLVNLITSWPGKQGKGDAFDMKLARRHAEALKTYTLTNQPPRLILLMGRKVRRAMGVNGNWDYLEWFDFMQHRAAVFPHPSGINRWWNEDFNQAQANEFMVYAARGLEG